MALGDLASVDAAEVRLMSVDELARLLDVSTRTVWRMRSARRIPQPVRIGGAVRWPLEQIKRWIAAGCPAQGTSP